MKSRNDAKTIKRKKPVILKSVEPEKENIVKRTFNILKKTSNIALILAGAFATATGFTINQYLTPIVEFEQTNSLSVRRPFESLFELRNKGHVAITDVKIVTLIDSMKMSNGSTSVHTTITNFFPEVKYLGANQTATLFYDMVIGPVPGYTRYAKMAFLLKYKFLGFSRKHVSFYQCIVDDEKKVIWAKDVERNYVKTYEEYNRD